MVGGPSVIQFCSIGDAWTKVRENRIVLEVIWYVLTTGRRWADVPSQMGCSGETVRTRLVEWQQRNLWGKLHWEMLRRDGGLEQETVIVDSVLVRALGGGEYSGPQSRRLRKTREKIHILRQQGGVPLAVRVAGANESDKMPKKWNCIFLPAYSPEWNPIEHLWRETKQKWFPWRPTPPSTV